MSTMFSCHIYGGDSKYGHEIKHDGVAVYRQASCQQEEHGRLQYKGLSAARTALTRTLRMLCLLGGREAVGEICHRLYP